MSLIHFRINNVPIHEIVCVSPQPYYLDWLEKPYPNISLNLYGVPFCLQCMNIIQDTKTSRQKWNRLLDAAAKKFKYKKRIIDHAI